MAAARNRVNTLRLSRAPSEGSAASGGSGTPLVGELGGLGGGGGAAGGGSVLGVLAGGVAHDFNNLLVGILANASFALGELPGPSEAR